MQVYRLLIADDEEMIRTGLSETIDWRALGFRVVGTVANGISALDFMDHEPVDVLLADIRMPRLSGLELARQLKGNGSSVKVVILSGYDSFPYAREAIDHGVFSYILKPCKTAELQDVFRRLKAVFDKDRHDLDPTQLHAGEGPIQPKHSVAMVLNLIERCYADDITLDDAAAIAGLSSSYLSRLFKEEMGTNFKDYLTTYRLERAKAGLRDPRRKIYEVAEEVGFRDQRYFSEVFKKRFGYSPLEYRDHPV
jgi:two-component system response regulator YesN